MLDEEGDGGAAGHASKVARVELAGVAGDDFTWRIARMLGDAGQPLTAHRWAWFAGDGGLEPGEWHANFRESVWVALQPALEAMEANRERILIYEREPYLDVFEDADAYLCLFLDMGRKDGFAKLRERAEQHFEVGVEGCGDNDRTCVNGTEEWVADFILMCICNDVVAEDVDAAFLHGQPAAFAPASAPTLSSHTDVTVRGGVGE